MSETADFVIVGAGAAGCLLANRLSADPSSRVLLLEAGGRDWNPLIRLPVLAGLLYFMKSLNWNYQTRRQSGLAGRSIVWPRGRVLGGSTAINGMMHIRGNRLDYDNWQQLGLTGWGYDDVLPYFRAFERNLTHGDRRYHGHEGELWTERAKGENPLYSAWLDSAYDAGYPANGDFNGLTQEGLGLFDFNIRKGHRVSASAAFLDPVRGRANLRVQTRAHVARVVFDGERATGLELIDGTCIAARKEVILAAGAVNSPQILELSGIGDAQRLRRIGIEPLVHAGDVGRNLQDHLGISVQYSCTQPLTLYGLMRPDRAAYAGLKGLLTGRGPATSVPLEAGGFVRTTPELERPNVHVILVPGLSLSTTRLGQMRHGFSTSVYQLRPLSRGSVHASSSDPREKPDIDPNYLSDPADLDCLVDGVSLARRLVGGRALASYRGEELAPGAGVTSRDALARWVCENASTVFHPVGTCRMGVDPASVVDGELRVRGTEGLRVVDASVMPNIISGNTSAPTMMIAEKAAAMIRAGAPNVRTT